MIPVHVHNRIAGNVTTPFIGVSTKVCQVAYCCTDSGSQWVFSVQDRSNPPRILVTVPLSPQTTPDQQKVYFEEPIPMSGGVDVVTAGGTPGIMDLWIDAQTGDQLPE